MWTNMAIHMNGIAWIGRLQSCCNTKSITSMVSWRLIVPWIITPWSYVKFSRPSECISCDRWIMSSADHDEFRACSRSYDIEPFVDAFTKSIPLTRSRLRVCCPLPSGERDRVRGVLKQILGKLTCNLL